MQEKIIRDDSELPSAERNDGAEADAPEPNEPVDEPVDDDDA
jgi:hypothetical protein